MFTQFYVVKPQEYTWPILWTLVSVLFVALYMTCTFLSVKTNRARARPQDGRPPKVKRSLSLRVCGISEFICGDEIKKELTAIDNIKVLYTGPPLRMDKWNSCAIVDIETSLTEAELLQRLRPASKQSRVYDCDFYGITPLNKHENAKVDVIAVPGLASHAIGSWRSPGKSEFWLRDWLPSDVPDIQLLLYGYNTTLLESDSKQSVEELGTYFLETVKAFRASNNASRRPIIFIGHSLGGLLIKEALVHAYKTQKRNPENLKIYKACCGLLFFGVPNYGLRNEQLETIVEGQPNQALIRALVVDNDSEPSAFLKRIADQFSECFKRQCSLRVVSLYERRKSSTVQRELDGKLRKTGPKVLMVTRDSATSTGLTTTSDEDNIPLDTDHSGLVKYDSRTHGPYPVVKERVKRLVEEGPIQVERLLTDNLTEAEKRAWDNLNSQPYSAFRNSAKLRKPEQGTLQWLVREEKNKYAVNIDDVLCAADFISWRDSPKFNCLLVTASPGVGKSVMSNFILEHLERRSRDNSKIIYYFCNIRNDEASRNACSVLQALILQLCESRQRLFRLLPEGWTKNRSEFLSASFDQLRQQFEKLLHHDAYARVYCVIDGLDVYQEERMTELISILVNAFDGSATSKSSTKLLCTSRPNLEILEAWGKAPKRKLRCDPKDIEIFVHSQTASLNENCRSTAIEKLLSKPQKTFLWVDVVIKKIRKIGLINPKKIEKAIEDSSEDLDQLYKDLIRQEDPQAARLLCWVIYAKRPLWCDELDDAIAIDPKHQPKTYQDLHENKVGLTGEEVHKVLGTLLDVVGDTVHVIHQSVADFFEREQPFGDVFIGISPRLLPAYTCMAYLHLNDLDPFDLWFPLDLRFPFLKYASHYWYRHIDSATDIIGQDLLQGLLGSLIDPNSPQAGRWAHVDPVPYEAEIRHSSDLALEYDIGWLAGILLNKTLDGLSGCFDKDCLTKAAHKSGSVLKVLLEHGEENEIELSEESVIQIARSQGRSMMELLLKKRGADVQITQEVVIAAAGNWFQPEEVMKLLLEERRADVQITMDVLIAAVTNWRQTEGITRLLLEEREANIQITEELLMAAATNFISGKGVMELLCTEYENEVEITPEVVISAADNWHDRDAVLSLVEKSNMKNEDAQKLLLAAANKPKGVFLILNLVEKYMEQLSKITTEVSIPAARNWAYDGLLELLEQCGIDPKITQCVLSASKENRDGEHVTRLLQVGVKRSRIAEARFRRRDIVTKNQERGILGSQHNLG